MGFCVYFHRTWTPGYGEYVDPNRLSRFHRRLSLLKKLCAALFAALLLSAIALLLYLLYSQCNNVNCNDCKAGTNSTIDSHNSNNNVTPVTEAFAGPLGRFLTATKSSSETTTSTTPISAVEEEVVGGLDDGYGYDDDFLVEEKNVDEVLRSENEIYSEIEQIISNGTTAAMTTTTTTTTTAASTVASEVIDREESGGEATTVETIWDDLDWGHDESPTNESLIIDATTEPVYSTSDSSFDVKPRGGEATMEENTWDDWGHDESPTKESLIIDATTEPDYPTFDSSYDLKPDDEETLESKTGSKRDSPGYEETPTTSSEPATSSTPGLYDDYKECSESEFQCALSNNCIPMNKRCDGRFDCNNSNYLFTTSASIVMPHGDRSDELNCTCGGNFFSCNSTDGPECIHNSLVCDTVKDCSNGQDESTCTELSDEINTISKKTWNTHGEFGIEGFVLIRVKGSWHPYCSDVWSSSLAASICQFFYHSRVKKLLTVPLVDLNKKGLGNAMVDKSVKILYRDSIFVIGGQKDKPFPMTSGTVDEIATETYVQDGLNCTVAYLSCAKF